MTEVKAQYRATQQLSKNKVVMALAIGSQVCEALRASIDPEINATRRDRFHYSALMVSL